MSREEIEMLNEEPESQEDKDFEGPRQIGMKWTEISDRAWNGQPFRNFILD